MAPRTTNNRRECGLRAWERKGCTPSGHQKIPRRGASGRSEWALAQGAPMSPRSPHACTPKKSPEGPDIA
eukprot:4387598-Pyramimonas_sp.AAC.2